MTKGFTQIKDVDYGDTFSLVLRIASIDLLLPLVAYLDLELFQMDVNTTFLNSNLEKKIYVVQSIWFISKGQEDKVCYLKRPMVSSSLPGHGIWIS